MVTSKAEAKRVIIVLSSGRSGTSLLMQILGALGMVLSDKLIGPHYENSDGFFEDEDIVNLHKQLLADIGVKPILPLPAGWKDADAVTPYRLKIRALVEERLTSAHTIWGFKDPRTCALLPLWIEVLKSMWITPYFVLAVREPGAAVRSIIKQTNLSGEMAELVWLSRTCDALFNSAGDCCIVHYEDWFTRPTQLAADLLKQTGLAHHFKGEVTAALDGIIKPNLNRAIHDEYKITNPYVLRLYNALKECRGVSFDHVQLMQTVKECRVAMDSFRGWYMEALNSSAGDAEVAQSRKRFERKQAEADQLAATVKTLTAEREADQVKYARTLADFEQNATAKNSSVVADVTQLKRRLARKQAEVEQLTMTVKTLEAERETARVKHERTLAGNEERMATLQMDLEILTIQNNSFLKQLKESHERAVGLALRAQSSHQQPVSAKRQQSDNRPAQVTSMPLNTKVKKRNAKLLSTNKSLSAQSQPVAIKRDTGRFTKLWGKLKKNPHQFFSDSRATFLRPLRHLFKERF